LGAGRIAQNGREVRGGVSTEGVAWRREGEESLPKVAAILWRCLETAEGLTPPPSP